MSTMKRTTSDKRRRSLLDIFKKDTSSISFSSANKDTPPETDLLEEIENEIRDLAMKEKGLESIETPTYDIKLGENDVISRFSEEELKNLRKQFKAIDVDNDKKITADEFMNAFAIVPGHNISVSKSIFDALDQTNCGFISEEEFLRNMAIFQKGTFEEKAKFAFSLMNRSKTGSLSKNELVVLISGIFKVLKGLTIPGFDSKLAVEFATEVFNLLDTDKDGIVKFSEFVIGLEKNKNYIKCLGVLKNDQIPRINTNSGQLVSIGGKSWISAFEMMLGMRLALEYVSDLGRPAKKGDFTVKLTFDLPEIIATKSQFTDYAPHVFKQIRNFFGITQEEYIISLGPEQILGNLLIGNMSSLSEKVSDGKSGSFFFYSHDSRFMVKTIPSKEMNIFSNVLGEYYKHVSMNPGTLMVRMYASHEIDNTPFVVMGNCFESSFAIDVIYDLKGSTVGRTNPHGFVKKDLDLLEAKEIFKIGKEQKEKMMDMIKKDTDFLKNSNLIDYSLIVGIQKNTGKKLPIEFQDCSIYKNARIIPSVANEDGTVDYIYFFGIIDIFTVYDSKKEAEHAVKSLVHNSKKISAIPSKDYAKRFCDFMEKAME
eukprot:gene7784-12258_t